MSAKRCSDKYKERATTCRCAPCSPCGHLHTCTPAHLHTCTCTPAHLHTCTPAHLHTCTPAHLHIVEVEAVVDILVSQSDFIF